MDGNESSGTFCVAASECSGFDRILARGGFNVAVQLRVRLLVRRLKESNAQRLWEIMIPWTGKPFHQDIRIPKFQQFAFWITCPAA